MEDFVSHDIVLKNKVPSNQFFENYDGSLEKKKTRLNNGFPTLVVCISFFMDGQPSDLIFVRAFQCFFDDFINI